MTADFLNDIRSEIRFFMDKTFQLSLGYIGMIVASIAVVKFELVAALANRWGLPMGVLLCPFILVINSLYLTVSSAFVFAVLKRGYFILMNSAASTVTDDVRPYRTWEVWVRTGSDGLFGPPRMNALAWNVDNYYLIPLAALIGLLSVAVTVYPMIVDASPGVRAVVGVLFVAHLIPPVCILWATHRLDKLCRAAAQTVCT